MACQCFWMDARAENEVALVTFYPRSGHVTYGATATYAHAASPAWPYTYHAGSGTICIPKCRYRRVQSGEFVHNVTADWAAWHWRCRTPYKRIVIIPQRSVLFGPAPDLRLQIMPPPPPPPSTMPPAPPPPPDEPPTGAPHGGMGQRQTPPTEETRGGTGEPPAVMRPVTAAAILLGRGTQGDNPRRHEGIEGGTGSSVDVDGYI
jgi:hypothetical protein